jgi:nitroreductase
MDIYETIQRRRSVRKYSQRPVPAEAITRCLEAARLSPSWRHGQPWHFVLVRDVETIRRLVTTGWLAGAANRWMMDAPVVLVACADPRPSGVKGDQSYYLVDVAIAVEHFILAATAEGLGTCWIGGFDETRVRAVLAIPDHIRVVAMTPVGYPADEPGLYDRVAAAGKRLLRRKPLEEIVHHDRW